jgi:hypothetical protein
MLLHFLGLLLDQAAHPEATPAEDLYVSIAKHLRAGEQRNPDDQP